jgi:hypothetical protein
VPEPTSFRAEYAKLASDLPALARQFGCAPGAQVLRDLADFALALECIDRRLDDLAAAEDRRRLGDELLRRLRAPTAPCPGDDMPADVDLDLDLSERADRLARILASRGHGITDAFCRLAERALANTERMRSVRESAAYVACVEHEGRLTVEMTLLLLGDQVSPAFGAFLRAIAEMANLLDKLIDARADHRRGELALRPGAALHARLALAFLRRVPAAIARHPRPHRFLAWGCGWALFLAAPQLRAASDSLGP